MLLVAQGVAGGGILQAHGRRDIARVHGFDILPVVRVHLQDPPQAFAAVLVGVVGPWCQR